MSALLLREGRLVLVEPLDVLKDQIRELNVTLADDTAKLPALGGKLLSGRRHHRQWQLLVRGLAEEEIESLRAQAAIEELGLRTPSLEEIFVAYLKLAEGAGGEPAAAEVALP